MSNNFRFITRLLHHWYAENKRNLPWRETKDAYVIWLSEIILQQTRVEQGLPYFQRFLAQYPTVQDFAAANQDEILKLWQGLGYYSRARNMQVAAQTVVTEHGGVFPNDYTKVRALKGVGDYTTAAILSFAYDLPFAVVDGNVMRVFSRLYAVEEPIDTAKGKQIISTLAQQHLAVEAPANHNQAIMDFGALVCTPKAPNCADCPLVAACAMSSPQQAVSFPVKKGKTKIRNRYFNYFVVQNNLQEQVWMQQRKGKDIWQGLYEFPMLESAEEIDDEHLLNAMSKQHFLASSSWHLQHIGAWKKQVLSHQHIHYRFVYLKLKSVEHTNDEILSVGLHDIANFAVPKPIELEIARILD
ncbi:MAG: A/G-specific adenine glycosylase [Mangrovibacterium sp.]